MEGSSSQEAPLVLTYPALGRLLETGFKEEVCESRRARIYFLLMVVLIAYVQVQPDRIAEAIAACTEVRGLSVLEPGCDRYDFFQSPEDATRIVFVEEWDSKAALDLHFLQPAFLNFVATINPWLETASEIRIFESALLE